MKYIIETATGRAVHRSMPHTEHTITNASIETGIPVSQLSVVDDATTDAEWGVRYDEDRPWEEKIFESDTTMLPRWGEDMIDRDGIEDLPQALIDKYNAKKTLRSEKPK